MISNQEEASVKPRPPLWCNKSGTRGKMERERWREREEKEVEENEHQILTPAADETFDNAGSTSHFHSPSCLSILAHIHCTCSIISIITQIYRELTRDTKTSRRSEEATATFKKKSQLFCLSVNWCGTRMTAEDSDVCERGWTRMYA